MKPYDPEDFKEAFEQAMEYASDPKNVIVAMLPQAWKESIKPFAEEHKRCTFDMNQVNTAVLMVLSPGDNEYHMTRTWYVSEFRLTDPGI